MNNTKWVAMSSMAVLLAWASQNHQAFAQNPPGDQQQWWNPGDWFDDTPNRWPDQGEKDTHDYDFDFQDDDGYYSHDNDRDHAYGSGEENQFSDDHENAARYGDSGIIDTNDWYTDDYWESGWNDDGLGDWDNHDPAWNNDDGYWDDSWD